MKTDMFVLRQRHNKAQKNIVRTRKAKLKSHTMACSSVSLYFFPARKDCSIFKIARAWTTEPRCRLSSKLSLIYKYTSGFFLRKIDTNFSYRQKINDSLDIYSSLIYWVTVFKIADIFFLNHCLYSMYFATLKMTSGVYEI